ncbi:MAG: helix-turn-helix transcriptional regulator [Clostridiaceae bacterium]|nr:helix-turn-helix transcriptional regulator [Clostridiaceae bacterium]
MDNQILGSTLSGKIVELRKKAGMTQEQLADKLGLSFQAVSKWENGQSFPDILLLPELGKIFGVSIDALFGLETPSAPPVEMPAANLPWPDDQTLRLVLFQGRQLLKNEDSKHEKLHFIYDGAALNVTSQCSITCDTIEHDAAAGCNLTCGDIGGSCSANGTVNCGDINGSCSAGGTVNCGDIGGNCEAGGSVDCGDIGGDCTAGGSIDCGDIGGSIQNGNNRH